MSAPERHIVLLMKPPETQFFTTEIHRISPRTTVHAAHDLTMLRAATAQVPETARLIAFSTSIIVPATVLRHFKYNAYNFHPGPPEYPGNRPSAFAIYDGAKTFGVTLHEMADKVDSGPIVAAAHFPVGQVEHAQELALEAYRQLARLFLRNLARLIKAEEPLAHSHLAWSGEKGTIARCEALKRIDEPLEMVELQRRLRAFDGIYSPLPRATGASLGS